MTGWNRQGVLALAFAGAAVAGLAIATPAPLPDIIVYKTSTCGCCKKWVEHLEAAGFRVTVHDTVDMAGVAAHYGVPRRLSTCHTALVQGYLVEGHVRWMSSSACSRRVRKSRAWPSRACRPGPRAWSPRRPCI